MRKQQNSSKRKPCVENRHPTEKKCRNPTDSPSPISIGKRERALLRYLYDSDSNRFNIKAYSRETGIKRPTIYDTLDRLKFIGLVIWKGYGCHQITDKGKAVIEAQESVGSVRKTFRGECRKEGNLSTHFAKYKAIITNRSKFSESFIKKLNPLDWKMTELPNLVQYHIMFSDASITINPKKVVINIHDIITDNIDDAHIELFKTALFYIQKVKDIGIETEGMILDKAHYARIESILSDALHKIDERYFLDLGNGFKFWIDHSTGKREDETNHEVMRARLDEFLFDMPKSKSNLSDVDSMKMDIGTIKDILTQIAKIEAYRHLPAQNIETDNRRPDYFG